MKIITFLVIVLVILLCNLNSLAVSTIDNNIEGELFTLHNKTFIVTNENLETGKLINEEIIEDNIRTIESILNDLKFLNKYNFEVIMSTHKIKGTNKCR